MPIQSTSQIISAAAPVVVTDPVVTTNPVVVTDPVVTVTAPVASVATVSKAELMKSSQEIQRLGKELKQINSNDPNYKDLKETYLKKRNEYKIASKGLNDTTNEFVRTDALNLKFEDSLCQGFYLDNWKSDDKKWTQTPKSYDDLGDDKTIVVNGLELGFAISENEYMSVLIDESSNTMSYNGDPSDSTNLNYNTLFEWVDYEDGPDTITPEAYFKFNVLKVKDRGQVELARIDYFSRLDDNDEPVLAMQLLILWKDTKNFYSEIEFRPKYYTNTALGDTGEGYDGEMNLGSHGQCQVVAYGIHDQTMKQLKEDGVWRSTGNARDVFNPCITSLSSDDLKNDSIYIRYLHASFGKIPRTS